MLVLTRRENESLVIGGDIKLTVLSVKGGQVRIGIDAPKEIAIHRQEILLNTEKVQNQEDQSLKQASDKQN